jgi:hypothetical protein
MTYKFLFILYNVGVNSLKFCLNFLPLCSLRMFFPISSLFSQIFISSLKYCHSCFFNFLEDWLELSICFPEIISGAIQTESFPSYFLINLCYLFIYLLFSSVGVHCSIYKSSYNVSNTSYFNSSPSLLSYIPSSPDSGNSFNMYHFWIYIYVYTLFAQYSSSYLFPHFPPVQEVL